MTNHHCFCTWWCKFSCSILYEMCKIILAKLLLKLNPISSVKGDSFNRHAFLCVDDKVTPLGFGASHLALNLGIVSMILFQFGHVSDPLTKELRVRAGFKRAHLKLCFRHFTSSSPKGSSQLASITFASGEHPRIGELLHTTNPVLKTCTGVF